MKAVICVFLFACMVALISAQADQIAQYAMLRALTRGSSSSSGGAAAGAAAGGAAAASPTGGNMFSRMMRGGGGLGGALLLRGGGGDALRDMMMCGMYPRAMQTLCYMRMFQ